MNKIIIFTYFAKSRLEMFNKLNLQHKHIIMIYIYHYPAIIFTIVEFIEINILKKIKELRIILNKYFY